LDNSALKNWNVCHLLNSFPSLTPPLSAEVDSQPKPEQIHTLQIVWDLRAACQGTNLFISKRPAWSKNSEIAFSVTGFCDDSNSLLTRAISDIRTSGVFR
jgi:hypothetical protein